MMIFLAFFLGACWRRWFGSARPDWAFTGYRGMQVAAGIGVLALVAGPSLLSLALAGAAVGWMTLPISISRQPFVWLAEKLPLPTIPYASGSAEWGEVFQGALLFTGAAIIAVIL